MLVGHQKQWQFLKKSAKLGRLSHAYLFSGEEKLGKRTFALEWVSQLFGESRAKLLAGSHPDFILIEPIQKHPKPEQNSVQGAPAPSSALVRGQIEISQIKDLNWFLSLRPYSAPFKTVIIDRAHSMNQEAQNCFLKTLEEPRGETLLILISEHPEFLFPTIRSRLEIIKFYPVPKNEIENYLREQGIEEKKIQAISQISQGKPGVAIDFLCLPQKLEERNILLQEIIKIVKADLIFRFQYAKKISKAPNLKEILNIWLSYFQDVLLSRLKNGQKILESDINRLKEIQKIIFLISTTNINPRLALETLMLEL